MNERIRELAREAAGGLLSYDAEGEFRLSEKEVEKFAELIVRECAKVGERYADGNYEVFNQILEHFGLEEE